MPDAPVDELCWKQVGGSSALVPFLWALGLWAALTHPGSWEFSGMDLLWRHMQHLRAGQAGTGSLSHCWLQDATAIRRHRQLLGANLRQEEAGTPSKAIRAGTRQWRTWAVVEARFLLSDIAVWQTVARLSGTL
jgi:hypothetical protein